MYKYLILYISLLLVPFCLQGQTDIKNPEMKLSPVKKDTFSLTGPIDRKDIPRSVANPDYQFNPKTGTYYMAPVSLTGYAASSLDSLRNDFYYKLFRSQEVWPGITVINSSGGRVFYQPKDQPLSFSTAMYLLQYNNLFGRVFNDAVVQTDVSLQATPWLSFSAYGQYAAFAKENARKGSYFMPPMIPTTAFGVGSTVMFNKNIGIMGGVGRQFNPNNGKWETTYMFSPVVNITHLFK